MGFAIEKLFLFTTQSSLYLSCRNKVDAKATSPLSIIGSYHYFWAVQVYDQVGEHVV